jgi:hypothetical protein
MCVCVVDRRRRRDDAVPLGSVVAGDVVARLTLREFSRARTNREVSKKLDAVFSNH